MPPAVDATRPAAPAEDGRTARSRRTRTAVVDALLALQEEGLSPTAQQVAERAGVALRTVFGHFSNMEALWVEAGQRELARLEHLVDPVPADLPLPARIERFAASRARVLERLMPVARAARLREPASPALMANRALFIAAGDDEARRVFAPELAGLDAADAARLLDLVYLAAAAPTWEVLRHDRGLPVDDARDVVRTALTALLTAGGTP